MEQVNYPISKEAFLNLKARIKHLAAEQVLLRPQRKQSFTGVRTPTRPYMDTAMTMVYNKFELRYLYLAYGIARGKTIEQIETKNREGNKADPNRVQQVIEVYEKAVRNNAVRSVAA